jgi:hypothetical protein
VVTIPVPSQPKLHKQWCLFDQSDNIDFDREVRKIVGAVDLFEETINDDPVDKNDTTIEDADNFISQLTLLDVTSPVKRDLEHHEFARGVKDTDDEKINMKNKKISELKSRNTKSVKRNTKRKANEKVTYNVRLVRMTKQVSSKRH